MNLNYFQFNNKFFKRIEGTAMGNSLSPFLANLFMSKLETTLKNELKYFSKIWLRYLDDIFAVFDNNNNINDLLTQINSKFNTIKFTCEIEKDGTLPFLDTLIIRNNNKLEFDIYRKETSIKRFITKDSNHCCQHKLSAFNSMIHRALNFPLTKERFNKEIKYIEDIAEFNGYSKNIVHNILRKAKYKMELSNITTLKSNLKETCKNFISLPHHSVFKDLPKMLKKFDFKIAYNNNNSLKNLLGNPKDKTTLLDKSGIYKVDCLNCNNSYIGQTRRSLQVRFKEHLAHLK